MSDSSNPYGLEAYVPQPKPKAQAAQVPPAPAERCDPVSGLRYFEDINAAAAPQPEAPSLLARAQAAFSRWFKGEDQLPVTHEQPAQHARVAPAAKKPGSGELSRYEDVIAGITDGPKFRYGEAQDAPSQPSPASQLKPYVPQR